ncbi:hypothetical protein [Paenibacillus sp. GCM10023250]|uniref:hypothetical protein n=1 Tax=Paenibacillus sp. GCM10023250 TaxID=3252648 RepID=UPI003616DD10
MVIFYRNRDEVQDNYSFDMNESGVILSENRQYQMHGDTELVFNSLAKWIKAEGVYIESQ